MTEKLILGTVQLGIPYGINNSAGKPGEKEANAILDLAKYSGINTLDTAKAYGTAIEVIGNYHRTSDFLFRVISKFHAGSDDLVRDVETELDLAGVKYFDAYLFHSFHDFETLKADAEKQILDLKARGSAKKIGVSVYGNEQFEKAIASKLVDLIQFPYNLLDNDSQRGEWIAKAKASGKELHIRSVFLQGLFFMDPDKIPAKITPLRPYLEKLKEIAKRSGHAMQELALAYALQNTGIDKVLVGVDSAEQLEKNIALVNGMKSIPESIRNEINNIHVIEKDLLSPVNWK